MKRTGPFLALFLVAISFLVGCMKEETPQTDYRPMIFFDNTLWGDTGKSIEALPEGFTKTGTIEQTVSQTEPFVREEGMSNTLPQGTAVCTDSDVGDKLYAAFESEGGGTVYLEYVVLES